MTSLDKKNYHKAKNSSKKRKEIFFRCKEEVKEFTNVSIEKVHKNKFLLYPFGKYIKNTREEIDSESEWNDRGEYRFGESLFPRESMQKDKKKKPCTCQNCTKCVESNTEEIYRGIHYQLKINN